MASLRQYNIVTLGQTGVGKSSFINSLANFMTYETFKEALQANQPKIVIDTSFQLHLLSQKNPIKINMRGLNPTEIEGGLAKIGATCTTKPSIYSFGFEGDDHDVEFNIIDVPGFGEGIRQDAVNRQAIIKELSRFPEIHGIIIMLKIDMTKMNREFQYFIHEILSCFHKNAQENIFFVLTFSGTDGFSTGISYDIYQHFFDDLNRMRGTNISLKDRIFLIDNEPFRFLCGYNQSEDFRQIFGTQERIERLDYFWTKSRENTFELLRRMYDIPGHKTEESRIIARASTAIQCCVASVAEVMHCMAEAKTDTHRERSIRQLMEEGTFDKPDLDIGSQLPRLVCTDKECIQVDMIEGEVKNVKVKQVCHENCTCEIDGFTVARCPEPLLINCKMFDKDGNCRICKHHVDKHMHLPFEIVKKFTTVQNSSQRFNREAAENAFDDFIRRVEQEQEQIQRKMVLMSVYCKHNAIVAYNNCFKNKINIKIEAKRMQNDEETVRELETILAQHEKIVSNYGAIDRINRNVTINDVVDAVNELFRLRIYGDTIRTLFDKHLPEVQELSHKDFVRLSVNYIPIE